MTLDVACRDCGLPYADFPLDTHLPRAQWLAIHPDDGGVLCPQCIVRRVKERIAGATVIHMIVEVSLPAPAERTALDREREKLINAGFGSMETQAERTALERTCATCRHWQKHAALRCLQGVSVDYPRATDGVKTPMRPPKDFACRLWAGPQARQEQE